MKTDLSEVFGSRYEKIKTLGEGAVGAVYLVKDREQSDKLLALKVLINEIDLDENTAERFKREISILQGLNHPNIVKAYDLIETGCGLIAYTMEYVEGADLGTLYKSHNYDALQIESIIIQLLSALSALHAQGIWHRDIKLENIIIKDNGDVKLADLGLIKNEFDQSYTKTGILLGTAQYMPPEYVTEARYDGRGDLYAAGVVFYELLKKSRRYPNLTGNQVVDRLIKSKFRIPQEDLLGIEEKYVEIINKAVEPSLRSRFQTAEEMISAIETNELVKTKDKKQGINSTINLSKLNQQQKVKKPLSTLTLALIGSMLLLSVIVLGLLFL